MTRKTSSDLLRPERLKISSLAAAHWRAVYSSNAQGATVTRYARVMGSTWSLFRLVGSASEASRHAAAPFTNGHWQPNADDGNQLLTVEWRKAGSGEFELLATASPVVRRGETPVDLEFQVTMAASTAHLRSAILTSTETGSTTFTLVSGATEHWHISTSDNAEILQAVYRLPKEALQGVYGFSSEVAGHTLNREGAQQTPVAWRYDQTKSRVYSSFAFSVING